MTTKLVDHLPTIESPVIGIDIETTYTNKKKDTADPFVDRIVSIQVSDGNDVWILQDNFTAVIPLLIDPDRKKIIHSAIFDCQFLDHQLGIRTRNIWDSLIMERVIYTGYIGMSHSLDSVLARRMGVILNKETRNQFANHTGPLTSEQIKYAADDVAHLIKLRELQLKDISDQQLGKVAALENAFTPVLVKASLAGVRLDHELWEQQSKLIRRRAYETGARLAEMAGLGVQYDIFGDISWDMNFGSNEQLKKLLRDKFKLEDVTSVSEEALMLLSYQHGGEVKIFIDALLEHREWQGRLRWHYDDYINPVTGKIHAVWNQLQASTGRMSCSDPNLQNVPNPLKGKEGDPNFRLLFLPPETNWSFVISDFSKQEPGILAHLSQDERLIDAYNSADVYVEIAKAAYGKEEISKIERYNVKQGLLSCFYGAGIPKLAGRMGLSLKEAEDFRNRVHQTFPKTARWSKEQEGILKRRGFTMTLTGRRQNFNQIQNGDTEGYYGTVAVNYPVQGSAVDMFKLGAVYLDKAIGENQYNALADIFIHDEIVAAGDNDQTQELKYQVVGAMEKAASDLCTTVEIKADAFVNERWAKD